MRLVSEAKTRPMGCAVLPHLGPQHPEGFIDTGSEMPGFDNHVYVSVVAVRQMCALLGFPTPVEHEAVVGELERTRLELEQARSELAEADRFQESIVGMSQHGFEVRRRKGRPPGAKEEGVAA